MRLREGLIVAILTFAYLNFVSLAHAQVQPNASWAPPKDFRLVWLITDRAGKPLGVFAFPEHMILAACARRAMIDMYGARPPFEQSVGNYISDKLDTPLSAATPVCLTDAELDALVRAVKVQTDTVGEGM